MDDHDIALVLRWLSNAGCAPEAWEDGSWTARCPVHGGLYRALVVRRGGDGSVSLVCRSRGRGDRCSEGAIWQALGLPARQSEPALAVTAPLAGVAAATGSELLIWGKIGLDGARRHVLTRTVFG
jgi:hypothetical protein